MVLQEVTVYLDRPVIVEKKHYARHVGQNDQGTLVIYTGDKEIDPKFFYPIHQVLYFEVKPCLID